MSGRGKKRGNDRGKRPQASASHGAALPARADVVSGGSSPARPHPTSAPSSSPAEASRIAASASPEPSTGSALPTPSVDEVLRAAASGNQLPASTPILRKASPPSLRPWERPSHRTDHTAVVVVAVDSAEQDVNDLDELAALEDAADDDFSLPPDTGRFPVVPDARVDLGEAQATLVMAATSGLEPIEGLEPEEEPRLDESRPDASGSDTSGSETSDSDGVEAQAESSPPISALLSALDDQMLVLEPPPVRQDDSELEDNIELDDPISHLLKGSEDSDEDLDLDPLELLDEILESSGLELPLTSDLATRADAPAQAADVITHQAARAEGPVPEAAPDLEAEPVLEAAPVAEAEPVAEAAPDLEAEPVPEAAPDLEAQPDLEAEAVVEMAQPDAAPEATSAPIEAQPVEAQSLEAEAEAAEPVAEEPVAAASVDVEASVVSPSSPEPLREARPLEVSLEALSQARANHDQSLFKEVLGDALSAESPRPTLFVGLGTYLTQHHAQEEARAVLVEGLKRSPTDTSLLEALAEVELRLGNHDAARQLHHHLLTHPNPQVPLVEGLGAGLRRALLLGELSQAAQLLSIAEHLTPQPAWYGPLSQEYACRAQRVVQATWQALRRIHSRGRERVEAISAQDSAQSASELAADTPPSTSPDLMDELYPAPELNDAYAAALQGSLALYRPILRAPSSVDLSALTSLSPLSPPSCTDASASAQTDRPNAPEPHPAQPPPIPSGGGSPPSAAHSGDGNFAGTHTP